MKENGSKNRREAGKNPETGRFAGRGERPTGRGTGTGNPTEGGVNLRTLDELQAAGMLSGEGKRLREQMTGVPAAGPKRYTRSDGTARPMRSEGPSTGRPTREGEAYGAGRFTRAEAPTGARRPTAAPEPGRRPAPPKAKVSRNPDSQTPERLHKVMAQAGLASRRHSEELIQAGRVSVNGQVVTQLGTKVIQGRDLVEVDGRPLGNVEEQVYILLNKPKGFVTTLYDPQGRKKVTDLLGAEVGQRVYPVGRLDYDTEGLLLLTNDGELANTLMHPAQQIKKTYIAKVRGVPNPGKITQLEHGVELEDGMTAPADVKLIDVHGPNAATLSIRIHEGRNRQVRRMFEAIGHEVIHLKRTTLGPLNIRTLPLGEWRYVTPQELMDLRSSVGDKTAARGAMIAEMGAIRKGEGRRVTREGAPTGDGRPAPRIRPVQGFTQPVRGTTQPVSEGTRPVLGRPQRVEGYARPEGQGERRPFDRPGFAPKGRGAGEEGPKPRFDRAGGDRPSFNREGAKPRFNREGSDRPSFDRAGGDRPSFNREGGKPRFNREGGDRPSFDRAGGDRPSFNREGGKPRFNREGGGRPDRESTPKPRLHKEGHGKDFARPAGDFNPRPGFERGGAPKGRPNREGGERTFARPKREGGGPKVRTGPDSGPKRRP